MPEGRRLAPTRAPNSAIRERRPALRGAERVTVHLGTSPAAHENTPAYDPLPQYKLPSPYWSSQFIYHVPRDVAYDLICADKKYITPFKKP